MILIKNEILHILIDVSEELRIKQEVFIIQHPEVETHGDYTSNIALVLASKMGKDSREIADLIKGKIEKNNIFKKIEIAGPGFINFFIDDKIFIENLKNIDKNYGKNHDLKNEKVIVDYTDPNPFKEFHIGHLMSNAIGESLARIFEFQGAKVKRVCFQGDVGMHVAKAIWGMMEIKSHIPKENVSLENKMKFLSQAYALGSKMYIDSDDAKREIVVLNKKIFNKSDKEINELYKKGKKWSRMHFDELYKKLDTKFNYFIFESEVSEPGRNIVEKGLKDNIFENGENGAIIFRGEKYGLHTRVFINSEGLPTYEAKDLGLAEIKYKKYPYDISVVITANEQNSHFEVMLKAMEQVNPELAEKTKHIGHGMLRLPEGKMSSRTGRVVTGESLIEKVEELVREKIKNRELTKKEKQGISQKVAIGAIKYSILKQSIGSDIIYDFNKSISFDGDSGPYLQYSYVRALSVLRKAKKEGIKPSFKKIPEQISHFAKIMHYFPESIEVAGKSYQPHFILLYLTELAAAFNSYYAKNKIVDKSEEFSPYKIALTKVFANIMENGMWLLGIEVLNKM